MMNHFIVNNEKFLGTYLIKAPSSSGVGFLPYSVVMILSMIIFNISDSALTDSIPYCPKMLQVRRKEYVWATVSKQWQRMIIGWQIGSQLSIYLLCVDISS